LRLRLEAADLALGDVSVAPCPEFDIPGVSLERVPGTIIDQHPAGGENVVLSTVVDVTVCLPDRA
jgi:beta-lactam-binding protein with PASTA domain